METMMLETGEGLMLAVSDRGVAPSTRQRGYPGDLWDSPEGFESVNFAWMPFSLWEDELKAAHIIWAKEKPAESDDRAGPVTQDGDQPS